jgi:transposase InsO family protein
MTASGAKELVMPWQEVAVVSQRAEFVALALQEGANVRALCRRFGISPPTAYKWLRRYQSAGVAGLVDQSRRPHRSPRRTPPDVETLVISARDKHPAWGGRKLAAWLNEPDHNHTHAFVPPPSTVTEILRRAGRLSPPQQQQPQQPHRWQRFERAVPNELWQMDFKGHLPLGQGAGRLHPLTILDDHSRFAIGLEACANERGGTVQQRLIELFRRYGLPDRMLMDNGSPWGVGWHAPHALTQLGVWLLRLGIRVSHGRALHPQTQGKDERFHRTLKAELLQGPPFPNLAHAQLAFDAWRDVYNLERPHEACGLEPPVRRYRPSERAYPEQLPSIEYAPDDQVRRVNKEGAISYRNRDYQVGLAFRGQTVAVRPTLVDGIFEVYFVRQCLRRIDLRRQLSPDLRGRP